jgi:hypothetical protein
MVLTPSARVPAARAKAVVASRRRRVTTPAGQEVSQRMVSSAASTARAHADAAAVANAAAVLGERMGDDANAPVHRAAGE